MASAGYGRYLRIVPSPTLARSFAGAILIAILAGCSIQHTADAPLPQRPTSVSENPTCNDWSALPPTTRSSYADWRLWSLRVADGIPRSKLPTADQIAQFRDAMTKECHQGSLDVAALSNVSHDVYTAAFASRRYLSP
jgi:hypothetical protein